ncbi:sigma-70 family RNA polymerase sigma factor [Metabacillus malikii]|uniref:RNA polymerase sigma-70 factor (ECF subfamily) n=1 Tax=Metabacillus malikii TaxID=1504265 RepID=A0ABT9ZE81_9BACI|nr:sigma-70 family RNA polymerase sigma factor [Metabacillus malikii]MDQ0229878.1 RNA polymerase sigma-70 factor (ECF subfamily) [Metabacillus malikii]
MKHDIQTVKRAINGDAHAFEQLLFEEEKMLYYKALSYVGKKEEALDAIQETAYKAFLSIGQLRNPEYFSTWLVKILIRECYRVLRERDQMIPYEESELLKRLDSKQEDELDSFHLSEALSRLNSSYQTSIILYYYHDLTIKDISEIMEKPVSTVKTNLRRARKKLKIELERSYHLNEKVT